jgi:hypothetical protein
MNWQQAYGLLNAETSIIIKNRTANDTHLSSSRAGKVLFSAEILQL